MRHDQGVAPRGPSGKLSISAGLWGPAAQRERRAGERGGRGGEKGRREAKRLHTEAGAERSEPDAEFERRVVGAHRPAAVRLVHHVYAPGQQGGRQPAEADAVEGAGGHEACGAARERQASERGRREQESSDGDDDAPETVRELPRVVADGGHDEREHEKEKPRVYVLLLGVDRQERHQGAVAQHHQKQDRGGDEGIVTRLRRVSGNHRVRSSATTATQAASWKSGTKPSRSAIAIPAIGPRAIAMFAAAPKVPISAPRRSEIGRAHV